MMTYLSKGDSVEEREAIMALVLARFNAESAPGLTTDSPGFCLIQECLSPEFKQEVVALAMMKQVSGTV